MNAWRYSLVLALAAFGLAACDQQPSRTIVTAPQSSLPENTPVTAPADTTSAAPPAAPGGEGGVATTTPTTSGDNTAGATPPATDLAAAPATSEMGAPAAGAPAMDAAANVAAGTAAPTELQRFLEASAAADDRQKPAQPEAKKPEKVSALPPVRNPGDPEGALLLAQRPLEVPVTGVQPTSLSDQFELSRGQRKHEAIDIMAPHGTPVVAVDDGRIAKLFTSKAGGLTVYQFDPQQRLAYYYAHLQAYAGGVREGADVQRGDLIGFVGTSGNANPATPHLHFAVFKLGTPPRWWEGEPVNPYPALSRAQPAPEVAAR
jgi:peptidoglycan LD-endopeptidase LytH